MSPLMYFGITVAAIALVLVAKGVKRVPQGYVYIIERFGRYTQTLQPGLHFIVPFVDSVRDRLSLMETVLDIPKQNCIAADNVMVGIDAMCFFRIEDPIKASYEVEDLNLALESLVMTNIRNVIGGMQLDEALSKRDIIKQSMMEALLEPIGRWGVRLINVEVASIDPPKDIQDAMSRQMKAERDKRAQILEAEGDKAAAVTRAEGQRQAAVLTAEGEKTAAFLRAEAREREAEAEARATKVISDAIKEGDVQAIQFAVAKDYCGAMKAIGESKNSKVVMMPMEAANLMGSVAGITELLKSKS